MAPVRALLVCRGVRPTGTACHARRVIELSDPARASLVRRGFALEWTTLGWNVAGVIISGHRGGQRPIGGAGGIRPGLAHRNRRLHRRDLGTVGIRAERQRRGLRLIGWAFAALAVYLLIQSTAVLVAGYHPRHSLLGIIWTAVTAAAMFTLAAGQGEDRQRRWATQSSEPGAGSP